MRGFDLDDLATLTRSADSRRGPVSDSFDRARCRSLLPNISHPDLRNLRKQNSRLIERFFNKLKHFRRVATHYDKTARNFLAAVLLAATRLLARFESGT
jgi:hypothetical protein